MRSHLITLVALASSVVAQVPGIPDCAQSCLTGSYGGCQNIDPKCICSNTAYLAGLSCCVFQKCDAADQEKTIQFANSFCLGQGVTGLPQTASCAASQTETTAASTASSSPTSSVSVPASLSSSLASLGSSVAAQVSSSLSQNSSGGSGTTAPAAVTTSTPTGTATGASTGTSSAASSTSPGSGAQKTEVAGLGLAAVAGLLVLL